nr:immunoglobulin heavy chain junction region [Mus musculus]
CARRNSNYVIWYFDVW